MSILGRGLKFSPPAIRLRRVATMIGAGPLAGSASVAAVTASMTPASAGSTPCAVLSHCNDIGSFTIPGTITTGNLSSNAVAPGGSETLNNYGLAITIPAGEVDDFAMGTRRCRELPPRRSMPRTSHQPALPKLFPCRRSRWSRAVPLW